MDSKHPDLQAAIDERLQAALAQSNYRITLVNQKQNALLKLQKNSMYSINGGTFSITPELISFVTSLLHLGKDEAILLDINKNPISIVDLQDFADTIVQVYYEHMNDYWFEIKSITKNRNTKGLIL